MDINLTIIGQFITFALLVWFTMKYVWPPITKAMHDRETKIAAGLEAADRSKRELEMAEHQVSAMLRDAKQQATQIIEQANVQTTRMVEDAKDQAKVEGQRILERAQGDISREVAQAKEALRAQLATLAIAGAEKIIGENINANIHQNLLNDLAEKL